MWFSKLTPPRLLAFRRCRWSPGSSISSGTGGPPPHPACGWCLMRRQSSWRRMKMLRAWISCSGDGSSSGFSLDFVWPDVAAQSWVGAPPPCHGHPSEFPVSMLVVLDVSAFLGNLGIGVVSDPVGLRLRVRVVCGCFCHGFAVAVIPTDCCGLL
ncbi:hypothetical protein Dimus_037211 [Dionaea muscipula]